MAASAFLSLQDLGIHSHIDQGSPDQTPNCSCTKHRLYLSALNPGALSLLTNVFCDLSPHSLPQIGHIHLP